MPHLPMEWVEVYLPVWTKLDTVAHLLTFVINNGCHSNNGMHHLGRQHEHEQNGHGRHDVFKDPLMRAKQLSDGEIATLQAGGKQ